MAIEIINKWKTPGNKFMIGQAKNGNIYVHCMKCKTDMGLIKIKRVGGDVKSVYKCPECNKTKMINRYSK